MDLGRADVGDRDLFQAFDAVQIGEGSDVAVDIVLGIGGEIDAADGVDAGGVCRFERFPESAFSGGEVDADDVRGNLSAANDEEFMTIRGPTCGSFFPLDAGN